MARARMRHVVIKLIVLRLLHGEGAHMTADRLVIKCVHVALLLLLLWHKLLSVAIWMLATDALTILKSVLLGLAELLAIGLIRLVHLWELTLALHLVVTHSM